MPIRTKFVIAAWVFVGVGALTPYHWLAWIALTIWSCDFFWEKG